MPLFEVETDAHIIITWAADENAAGGVVREAYPTDRVIRMTKRPRDTWVISKGALGLTNKKLDVCTVARDCLSKAAGDTRSTRSASTCTKREPTWTMPARSSNRTW
jgi:hypothetical protein